jgi:hypothetical protein
VEEVKDSRESFMLSGLRHWFPTCQELYRKGWSCHAYVMECFTMLGMNNVHWLLEKKKYSWRNSPIANLERNFPFLWNLPVRSNGLQWLLGRCLHYNLLCDENLLWHQVMNAYHILRFPRKRHEQPSMKSIRFKVALEVNVLRIKNEPRPRV